MGQFEIDWGVHVPHLGRDTNRENLINFVQQLEKLGVHSGWVSDHVCWPKDIASAYPYTDDGSFAPSTDMSWLDPIGTLLFLAGCTTKLRLGTSVLILPYRQPVVTAKQLATLDVLSNGRLILGAGVGWMAEEAAILGMPWDQRGKRADEQLMMFAKLFGEAEPSFEGEFYNLPTVGFEPKPVQQPIPIWVGGSSEQAFRRAATFGSGFHAAFQPIETVVEEFAQVRRFAEEGGRDPDQFTLSLRVFLDPASAVEPAKSIAGSVNQMQDRVGELEQAGVSHILLDPVARGGVQGRLDAVSQFMEQVT